MRIGLASLSVLSGFLRVLDFVVFDLVIPIRQVRNLLLVFAFTTQTVSPCELRVSAPW